VWLAIKGKLRRREAVFAAACFCTLFTPIYAEYHILIFAGVLTVFVLDVAQGGTAPRLFWVWPGFLLLLCLGYTTDLAPTPMSAWLLLCGPLSLIAIYRLAGVWDEIPLLTTLLAMSPLGGGYSNGTLIAILLTASLTTLYIRAMQRPLMPE
jgi:hypothetical protein